MSSSRPTIKRKRLTLAQKGKILAFLSNGATVSSLAASFGSSLRFVQKIRSESTFLQKKLQDNSRNIQLKAFKTAKFPEVESLLFDFVHICRAAKLPICGATRRQRALQLRDKLLRKDLTENEHSRLQTFSASARSVNPFAQRHALQSVRFYGEGGSVSVENVIADISHLRQNVCDLNEEFVSNMDEAGLFFKLFPKKTYVLEYEDRRILRGTKNMKAKSRVSLYVYTNAT